MSNPREMLAQVMKTRVVKREEPAAEMSSSIAELISRAFATRNLTHFAHWATKSYAQHMALGDLYDEIISQIDEIVEVYQGKFGILPNLTTMKASVPKDILAHVEAEAAWVSQNRDEISNNVEAIGALLDELDAAYLKAIYKLKNLH